MRWSTGVGPVGRVRVWPERRQDAFARVFFERVRMGHKWKIGDWAAGGVSGKRWLIVFVESDGLSNLQGVSMEHGWSTAPLSGEHLTPLPDCNGWDWQPPKPEPQYRPFANAAEFAPHRDRWLRNKTGNMLSRPVGYSNEHVYFISSVGSEYQGSYQRLFANVTFDDGTPFGVEF